MSHVFLVGPFVFDISQIIVRYVAPSCNSLPIDVSPGEVTSWCRCFNISLSIYSALKLCKRSGKPPHAPLNLTLDEWSGTRICCLG